MKDNAVLNSAVRERRKRVRGIFVPDIKHGLKFRAVPKNKIFSVKETNDAFAVKINKFDFSFYKKFIGGKIFGLKIDDGEIQAYLSDIKTTKFVFEKSSDKPYAFIAKNIFPNTDLEYVILKDTVKENFIVNSRQEKYEYSFVYRLKRLYAKLSDDRRCLNFIPKGYFYPMFFIPLPFMYDSAGARSDAVYFEAEIFSKDFIRLKLIADAKWLNSSDRVFPVTIDPATKISGNVFDKFR